MNEKRSNPEEIADLVCTILTKAYVDKEQSLIEEAAAIGCTLEQLVSMAIAQLIDNEYLITKRSELN